MGSDLSENRWDEAWVCPRCGASIAMGDGKRGGGNAIVTFTKPPRCFCGAELEQRTSEAMPHKPEDVRREIEETD